MGQDFTGQRSVELCETLLDAHPNLYMSLKQAGGAANPLLEANGDIKQEWLALFNKYSDRFVLGSDHFYLAPGLSRELPSGAQSTVDFLAKLPMDLADKIAYQNAKTVFDLP